MNRRSFLTGLGALVAGAAVEKVIPFNRAWSFPTVIKPRTWDEITRLTNEFVVPRMTDYVFQNQPLFMKLRQPGTPMLILESTARGRKDWFYDQWVKGKLIYDEYAPEDMVYTINSKYLKSGLEFSCPPPELPLISIQPCPPSKIIPVETETSLVQVTAVSDLPQRISDLSRKGLVGSLRAAVKEFVSPIERAVRSALSSVEDDLASLFPIENV